MTNKRRRGSQSQAAIQASLAITQDRTATQAEFERLSVNPQAWRECKELIEGMYLPNDDVSRMFFRDELLYLAEAVATRTKSIHEAFVDIRNFVDYALLEVTA